MQAWVSARSEHALKIAKPKLSFVLMLLTAPAKRSILKALSMKPSEI
jgi:hypothetical protein